MLMHIKVKWFTIKSIQSMSKNNEHGDAGGHIELSRLFSWQPTSWRFGLMFRFDCVIVPIVVVDCSLFTGAVVTLL